MHLKNITFLLSSFTVRIKNNAILVCFVIANFIEKDFKYCKGLNEQMSTGFKRQREVYDRCIEMIKVASI